MQPPPPALLHAASALERSTSQSPPAVNTGWDTSMLLHISHVTVHMHLGGTGPSSALHVAAQEPEPIAWQFDVIASAYVMQVA